MNTILPNYQKQQALIKRMTALSILEQDIQETFVLGSGKGGQAVNKTHNAVQLTHIPTGVSVKSHKSRSRELNRFLARRSLCDAIETLHTGSTQKDTLKQLKIKKQKSRRKRRSKSSINKEVSS